MSSIIFYKAWRFKLTLTKLGIIESFGIIVFAMKVQEWCWKHDPKYKI